MRLGIVLTLVGLGVFTNSATFAADKAEKKRPEPDVLFKRLDTNNDEKLSKDEVKASKGKLSERVDEVFKRLDKDNDGFISKAEFKAIAMRKKAK